MYRWLRRLADGARRRRYPIPLSGDEDDMCGIAGHMSFGAPIDRTAVEHQVSQIRHRGPDDRGVWLDADAGIALGHARLSILDLSPSGHQPMQSACGRYRVVFNGEIYNFTVLRERLQALGYSFRGHSDTEVMLAAFTQWGIEESLPRLDGMFAFAVWDSTLRALYLGRDRLGEKPLYYGLFNKCFLFGSELKALRVHPAFDAQIDETALELYLRYTYVPGPHSIFSQVRKLPPGTFLRVDSGGLPVRQPQAYWRAIDSVRRGRVGSFDGSVADAEQVLDERLRVSVGRRMLADVPLGAFLSGGIDSSTIVALMQRISRSPVRTFTVRFGEQAYNEADWARRVAEYLSTSHTEIRVSPTEVRNLIPSLPTIYDEPFADQSQLPTCVLSEITRRYVTVALSGDGGDELFAGYRRYARAAGVARTIGLAPAGLRSRVGHAASALHLRARRLAETSLAWRGPAEGLRRLSELMRVSDAKSLYRRMSSCWQDPSALLLHTKAHEDPLLAAMDLASYDLLTSMTYADLVTYLPDDILVKVDRASMHVGLEVRVPFLDHHMVEFAATLPDSFKIRHGETKYVLKRLLGRYLPRHLFERPKQGFGAPVSEWLRGPLRAWARDLLSESSIRREGILQYEPIGQALREHDDRLRDRGSELWTLVMFAAWRADVFKNPRALVS